MNEFRPVPATLAQAQGFLARHHRERIPLAGYRGALALVDASGAVRAVAVLASPLLPLERDPLSLELRVVVDDGTPGAGRAMRAASRDVARALGAHELLCATPLELDLAHDGWEPRPLPPMRTTLSCRRWRCELHSWLELRFPDPPSHFDSELVPLFDLEAA